jgi:hypothetical protein
MLLLLHGIVQLTAESTGDEITIIVVIYAQHRID